MKSQPMKNSILKLDTDVDTKQDFTSITSHQLHDDVAPSCAKSSRRKRVSEALIIREAIALLLNSCLLKEKVTINLF